jgi:biopolymer transport protein ExbB
VTELFSAGGWVMWPLIFCSILALTVIMERLWVLYGFSLQEPSRQQLLAADSPWLHVDQASMSQLRSLSIQGVLFAEALSHIRQGRAIMIEHVEQAATRVAHELEQNMNLLGSLAVVSPLFGLLGTVVGMVEVFDQLMSQGLGDPAEFAGGIASALLTTAGGLLVGIPSLFIFRLLQRRIAYIILSLETETLALIDVLCTQHSEVGKS